MNTQEIFNLAIKLGYYKPGGYMCPSLDSLMFQYSEDVDMMKAILASEVEIVNAIESLKFRYGLKARVVTINNVEKINSFLGVLIKILRERLANSSLVLEEDAINLMKVFNDEYMTVILRAYKNWEQQEKIMDEFIEKLLTQIKGFTPVEKITA